jgi:hypothetical protein
MAIVTGRLAPHATAPGDQRISPVRAGLNAGGDDQHRAGLNAPAGRRQPAGCPAAASDAMRGEVPGQREPADLASPAWRHPAAITGLKRPPLCRIADWLRHPSERHDDLDGAGGGDAGRLPVDPLRHRHGMSEMTSTAEQISGLLHEAAETRRRVSRIVDGADDDWASW